MLLCAPQKLVVSLVPAGEVHPELWKGANRKFARVPWRKIELERHNAERTRSSRRDAARGLRGLLVRAHRPRVATSTAELHAAQQAARQGRRCGRAAARAPQLV